MREMELTTLSTEVQDIQNSTKDRQQKNEGLRETSPTGVGSNLAPPAVAVLNCFRARYKKS
jgi:hypothetical protein